MVEGRPPPPVSLMLIIVCLHADIYTLKQLEVKAQMFAHRLSERSQELCWLLHQPGTILPEVKASLCAPE